MPLHQIHGFQKPMALCWGMVLLLLAACGADVDTVAPVVTEQIEAVVTDYYERNSLIPEYEVEIQEVDGEWARVGIVPAALQGDAQPSIIYLQNQLESENPLPTVTVASGPTDNPSVATDTGWAIVAGPQATFTDSELDAAQIPEMIRP